MSYNVSIKKLEELVKLLNEGDVNSVKQSLESWLNNLYKRENRKVKKATYQKEVKKYKDDELITISKSFRDKLVINQTESEKIMKALLKSIDLEYEFQKVFFSKSKKKEFYIVDFYLPASNTVIEIDGEYHDSKDQKKLDKKRTKMLCMSGVRQVIRFNNKSIFNEQNYIINTLKTNQYISNKISLL